MARALLSPFTGDADHDGSLQAGHFAQVAGNGLCLTALFGPDAGIGARGIDEGDHRQLELLGHLHQAQRLAIAFGIGHAEVAVDLLLGVAPFLVADHHYRLAVETGQAADYGVVIAEITVAMQLGELGEHQIDVVQRKGTVDVACHLCGLPAGEIRENLRAHLLDASLQCSYVGADIQSVKRQPVQLIDLLFQIGDRFFKVHIHRGCHDDTSI